MALHNRGAGGHLAIAMQFFDTVLPRVLFQIDYWVFIVFHLTIFFLYYTGNLKQPDETMDWKSVQAMSSFTTVFQCFYTSKCYNRYIQLWDLTRTLHSTIHEACFVARLHFRTSGLPYDRVCSRWLVVALILVMYGVEGNIEVPHSMWNRLELLGLVKPHEVSFLAGLSSQQRGLVLCHAAADLVRVGLIEVKAPMVVRKHVTFQILKVRSMLQTFQDVKSFTMPGGYFHLLHLMVVMNLFVWGYGMGYTMSTWAPLFFAIAALIFLGLLELARQLSNPFGDDDVDFLVDYWVFDFLQSVAALMEYEHGSDPDNLKQDLDDEKIQRTRLQLNLKEMNEFLHPRVAAKDPHFHPPTAISPKGPLMLDETEVTGESSMSSQVWTPHRRSQVMKSKSSLTSGASRLFTPRLFSSRSMPDM